MRQNAGCLGPGSAGSAIIQFSQKRHCGDPDWHRWMEHSRIYHSTYSPEYLAAIAEVLTRDAAAGIETWCIFDNTAAFAATANALTTWSMVHESCHE